ncbi:hypothetical protein F8M41_015694 [Gigaspora margarita]|uniref:Uncharacterized protein n=1 Tax=Gigaspora margarita TaxID=4874 RepID=A0A8H3WTT1_GIGMA|nr:hypothetical protein F8M41_015694 [Gigaspora margarita]
MVGKCPGCGFTPRTGKTRDLNKHMDLTRSRPCQALLQLTQAQNASHAENATPEQNQVLVPKSDLISFDENPPMHQPIEAREPAVDLLTSDIPDIEVPTSNNIEQKKSPLLTIDELIKWLSKPEIKNNKKIRSKPIPKTDKEWFDLMELDEDKDSEPNDSEYDTADEDPDDTMPKMSL